MIYFLSDSHLGCRALTSGRTRERRLVRFLDSIRDKASAIYLMGDIFDYWFEYKQVVPKGHVRFLGKIAELTDNGIEVHFFPGNHDQWCGDYLTKECGVIIHHEPCTVELDGKVFYLAHGDGLGDHDRKYRFLSSLFHSRFVRKAFACLHPDHATKLGLAWAANNRRKHERLGPPVAYTDDREPLIAYSRAYLADHPEINWFIYGHRHVELTLSLGDDTQLFILGNWTDLFTYAVYDGTSVTMHRYIEGETKP